MNQVKENKSVFKRVLIGAGVVVLASVFFTSWYTVDETEQAVLHTFGKVDGVISEPGLKFKLPFPIQSVKKISKETFSLQFGYTEKDGQVTEERVHDTKMITGDENIVLADLVVQWKITDAKKYLYTSDQPEDLLYKATSASLRTVIGSSNIDDALTSGKAKIEGNVYDQLKELMKNYDIGIGILAVKLQDVELPNKEVRRAFTQVTDAREQMNTLKNNGEKYNNQEWEVAQGTKDALISKAEGDKTARIQRAKGDVSVFESVYKEYKNAPTLTKQRLVLETMDSVLPKAQIYIMKEDGSTMKYLPIQALEKSTKN